MCPRRPASTRGRGGRRRALPWPRGGEVRLKPLQTIAGWVERQPGSESMTVTQIAERVAAVTGQSWNKKLKASYGPIVDFLRSRHELLVDGDRVTVNAVDSGDEAGARSPQSSGGVLMGDIEERRAAELKKIDRSSRSTRAFLIYLATLSAVGLFAYSLWSGRGLSDLTRQLADELKRMES